MNKLNALLTESCSVKMAGYWPISFSPIYIYSHLHQTSLLHKGFIIRLACSKLRDSGEKSFRKKKMQKNGGGWGEIFPKLGVSNFRFARVNTSPLYYLIAWHRL